jgi:hypothetical protein
MAFTGKILRVLIASPSDMPEERSVATQAVHDWNAQHASTESVVLLPIRWETHAWPLSGARPQEIINRQLVRDSDLLIGMFWTKIGTKTGASDSGTVEEIEQFAAAGKPVMLYFSRRPVDPNSIDLKQQRKLRQFKTLTASRALLGSFGDLHDLYQTLLRDLTNQMRDHVHQSSLVSAGAQFDAQSG